MSFKIDHEWLRPAEVSDELEKATWARWALRVADTTLTRVQTRQGDQREALYGPLFPVAAWIVSNWWTLLYEADNGESPSGARGAPASGWLSRHCIRCADSGLLLPNASIFSSGPELRVTWRPDERRREVPVWFIEPAGERFVEPQKLRRGLSDLVTSVLERVQGIGDPRAVSLAADWAATIGVASDSTEFCRAAGRLGLDPFSTCEWPSGLVEWLEAFGPGELDRPLVVDLLELPTAVGARRSAIHACKEVADRLSLTGGRVNSGNRACLRPFEQGYELARRVRLEVGIADEARLDLAEAAEAIGNRSLVIQRTQELPGMVSALAGWKGEIPTLAVREGEGSKRFSLARGLGLALDRAGDSPRAVTDAKTSDQRFSRAFAAELLAPQRGVEEQYRLIAATSSGDEAIETLARRYDVSAHVIVHQLENHSLAV